MARKSPSFYVTTPIYYVNDRPHIGHCFTTIVADVAARFERSIRGATPPDRPGPHAIADEVFFLTGTDEHADKVVTSALEHGTTPQVWADRNAVEFQKAFVAMGVANDDFIRTSEPRHKERVPVYIKTMLQRGDVYRGEYTGWYDAGQEEYVTETAAKENEYKSPVNGRPLVRRTEPCYFFKLSKYAETLARHLEEHPEFVLPEARRSEVLGRLKLGLNDIPISRPVTDDPATQWGIRMPSDPAHRIYVWIDALFNYFTAVDTPSRRALWPKGAAPADARPTAAGIATPAGPAAPLAAAAGARASEVRPTVVQLIGKDILWFHAVIWPALLLSIGEGLPTTIYGHGWWLSEGQKMSKSLGNFIDLEQLCAYAQRYSLDALRWYLVTEGPLGGNDANFTHAKFVEVFNADLANGIGNCASRVANMVEKYFDGRLPLDAAVAAREAPRHELAVSDAPAAAEREPGTAARERGAEARTPPRGEMRPPEELAAAAIERVLARAEALEWGRALEVGVALVREVDRYINLTEPFRLAKAAAADPAKRRELACILTFCAETLRVAALVLAPAMPNKMVEALAHFASAPPAGIPLAELCALDGPHSLKQGTPVRKGAILFQRADPSDPPPRPA